MTSVSSQKLIPDTIATSLADFTGREWVFRRLDFWLAASESRTFLITGEPGSGKSTLAARLVQISTGEACLANSSHLGANCLTCFHFCRALGSETSLDPMRFVESISEQLAHRYPPFASALMKASDPGITINATQTIEVAENGAEVQNVVIRELHIASSSPRVAFDRVVRRPLEQLYAENFGEIILILVDALDEALTYNPDDNIVTLLRHITSDSADLPPQVRFVLTSRSDPRVSSLIGEASLNLITDIPDTVDDVQEYAYWRLYTLPEPQRRELAERVAKIGNGNFLYARYVLDDLLRRTDQGLDTSNLELPKDLKDIYRQFLRRELGQTLERWDERYGPLLGVMVVARGQGLTRSQLAEVTGHRLSEISGILHACAQYLTGSYPDGPFRFYHQSFRDFLLTDSEYRIYPADSNRDIARFFLEEYINSWLNCQDDYALRYTPSHLIEAAQITKRRRAHQELTANLVKLLTNFGFLEAKTALLGVDAVLVDLRSAISIISSESELLYPILALLRVLDREAHHLRGWKQEQHPVFFAQQLHNRALEHNFTALVTSTTTRISELSQPYMKLLWRKAVIAEMLERILVGHETAITATAVTSDGRYVLSGSADGMLRVWDLLTGQTLHILVGHETAITATAVTSDGRYVLSGSADGMLRVWDLLTGQTLHILTGHGAAITAITVTPDGRHAISSAADGTLKEWDWLAGQALYTFSRWEYEQSELVTADGRLALSSFSDGTIGVWDLQTGQFLHTLSGHQSKITSMTITPHGHHAISGFSNGTLEVWDLLTGKLLHTLNGSCKAKVSTVVVTTDDQCAVSGFSDGTLEIWDLQAGQLLYTLIGYKSEITAIAVTPDRHRAISGFLDGTLEIWDLQAGQLLYTFSDYERKRIITLGMTADSRYAISGTYGSSLKVWDLQNRLLVYNIDRSVIAVGYVYGGQYVVLGLYDGALEVWNPVTGRLIRTLSYEERVSSVVVTADGYLAISGSADGTLKVWDLQTGQLIRTIIGHEGRAEVVALTPDGRVGISSSFSDRTLKVWDLHVGQLICAISGHRERVTAMAMAADGHQVISGSQDRTLIVWGLQTGQAIHTFFNDSQVTAMAVTPMGHYAISGTYNGILSVWDLRLGELLHTFTGHEGAVSTLAVTPDGHYVISGSSDHTLRIWDLQTGKAISILVGHEGAVSTLAVTPDGHHVISGSADHTLRIWDLQTGQSLQHIPQMGSVIKTLTVNTDGRSVVSGFSDGTLRIWDLRTGQFLHTLAGHENVVYVVKVTPDGNRIISGSEDQTVRVWDLQTGQSVLILGVWDKDGQTGQLVQTYKARNWRAQRDRHAGRLPIFGSVMRLLAIPPTGKQAIVGWGETLGVWDLQVGQIIYTLTGHEGLIGALAMTPDGHLVISGSDDQTARIWDLQTGHLVHTLTGHQNSVDFVALTHDSRFALSQSRYDKVLKVWDLRNGQCVYTLTSRETLVSTVVLTTGEYRAISSSEDGTLRMWDLQTGQTVSTLTGHTRSISAVVVTPNGHYAISGSADHTLRVWDLEVGREVAAAPLEAGLDCIALTPDGTIIVAGDVIGNTYCLRYMDRDVQ